MTILCRKGSFAMGKMLNIIVVVVVGDLSQFLKKPQLKYIFILLNLLFTSSVHFFFFFRIFPVFFSCVVLIGNDWA